MGLVEAREHARDRVEDFEELRILARGPRIRVPPHGLKNLLQEGPRGYKIQRAVVAIATRKRGDSGVGRMLVIPGVGKPLRKEDRAFCTPLGS